MIWSEFLTEISSTSQVTLVGPFYGEPHTPIMPTIYVDGGSEFRHHGGWAARPDTPPAEFPVVSVGDGDSSAGTLDEVLPAAKDYSDLAFALKSLPASVTQIEMLGFMGGRDDHHLANLGEIQQFLSTRTLFTLVQMSGASGERILAFCRGSLSFTLKRTFSVFVFEPAAVRISGDCRYSLSAETTLQPVSSQGLSNEGYGLVQIECEKPVFVFVNAP